MALAPTPTGDLPLRQIKPKNARTKRYLDHKAPQNVENPKVTLFLRYTSCPEVLQLVLKDLHALKRPLCIKFEKKNNIHPFEDPSSLEFFADKNDASMAVYGSHSKKRPNCLTLVRFFDYKVLDMVELLVNVETLRTLSQFRNTKPAVGLKPMLSFSGTAWDSPTPNAYTLAKSMFIDLFKGPDATNVDVQGLQYVIQLSVGEQEQEDVQPAIHLRCFLIKTSNGPNNLPVVNVEEMGPRIDFRIGRIKEADPDMLKEAMKKPKNLEAKTKKNIEVDPIGDKMGRIHVGKQDLRQLQTRKMKGLKRSRDTAGNDEDAMDIDDAEVDSDLPKKAKIAA